MSRLLNTSDITRRISAQCDERIPDRDRLFLDEYVDCYIKDTEEVYSSYGDNIQLLKKLKTPHRTVDTTGGVAQARLLVPLLTTAPSDGE